MTKRTTCWTLAAILAWAALSASSAQAKFVAVFEQVGSAVEEVGGGTIDLSDLSDSPAVNPLEASIAPVASFFISGASGALGQLYRGVTGPRNFGPGDPATAGQSAGDIVELYAGIGNQQLYVPVGYASGDPLSNSSAYLNSTFASLGMTPGAYVYTWGSDAHADSFTIVIGAPVPEPSTWAMGLLGFAGLGYAALRRKGALGAVAG
jgi:hypothetical protein